MNPKQTFKLATPELPVNIQRIVDKLQSTFVFTKELLEEIERSGKLEEKSVEKSVRARKAGNDLYAKKEHNSRIHNEILECYSQSIMYAPMGTNELVLGYSNRSVLLMHLQHYEESLVDIDRALQLSKSDEFKEKLQTRRDKCLGLINEKNSKKSTDNVTMVANKNLEILASKLKNFEPSAMLPCASDCVGLDYNNTFGRHLVATRDIEPGEILIVEKGSACYPMLHQINLVCSHCLQYAWNGIPCDECVYAIYCSEECKNEAFNEYHDIECPIVKYLYATVFCNEPNGFERMATVRLLIKAVRKEGYNNIVIEVFQNQNRENIDVLLSNGILKIDSFKACYNLLLSHVKDIEIYDEKLNVHAAQILYLLLKHTDFLVSCMGENSLLAEINAMNLPGPVFHDYDFTMDPHVLLAFQVVLIQLKHVMSTNGFVFSQRYWQCGCKKNYADCANNCNLVRGVVVVPCCSLLNHSCTSNVIHLCAPKRDIIVFSTCPIKKGEMLCDAYRGVSILDGDLNVRNNKLIHFTCKCKACLDKIDVSMVSLCDSYAGTSILTGDLEYRQNKLKEFPFDRKCKACLDNVKASMVLNDYGKDFSTVSTEFEKHFPVTLRKSFFENSIEEYEMSQEVLQHMIKMSKIFYQRFDYCKAFIHNTKCQSYIEKMMSTL